jgi:phosphotransferase system enzyme I (PtsI)
MKRFEGFSACDGIAIGPAYVLATRVVVSQHWIEPAGVVGELRRLEVAVDGADRQLRSVSAQLEAEHRLMSQEVAEAHRLLLTSGSMLERVRGLISNESFSVDSAVRLIVDDIVTAFEGADDPYLRERGEDVEAVGERLLRTLLGLPEARLADAQAAGAIGVARTLAAVDSFQIHRAGLAGLATERGGPTSHAAQMLRTIEIPYLFGMRGLCRAVRAGETLILDGASGEVIASPTLETLRSFERRRDQGSSPVGRGAPLS